MGPIRLVGAVLVIEFSKPEGLPRGRMQMAEGIAHGTTAGPARDRLDRDQRETKASAALWSAIWEASQFKSPAALRDFCESVIREIESDEP